MKVKPEQKSKLSEGAKHNYSWERIFQAEDAARELPACLTHLKTANKKLVIIKQNEKLVLQIQCKEQGIYLCIVCSQSYTNV